MKKTIKYKNLIEEYELDEMRRNVDRIHIEYARKIDEVIRQIRMIL